LDVTVRLRDSTAVGIHWYQQTLVSEP
jgi:hypothetical protein